MRADLRDVIGATVDGPHAQRRPLLCRSCDEVVIPRSVAQPFVSPMRLSVGSGSYAIMIVLRASGF